VGDGELERLVDLGEVHPQPAVWLVGGAVDTVGPPTGDARRGRQRFAHGRRIGGDVELHPDRVVAHGSSPHDFSNG
jgi:hypothetical protein